MAKFKDLKVGDKVIYYPRYEFERPVEKIITEETKTSWRVAGLLFKKDSGRERTSDHWRWANIEIFDKVKMHEINKKFDEKEERKKCFNTIKSVAWGNLSTEVLKKIVNIINKEQK